MFKLTTKNSNQFLKSLLFSLLIYGVLSIIQPVYAAIVLTSGGSQTVPANTESANIVFTVTDEFGTPSTGITDELGTPSTGISVNFTLTSPIGNPITQGGLTTYTATTDANGQVSTRLKGTGTIGNYFIHATQATEPSQFASTNIIVIAAPSTMSITLIAGGGQRVPAGMNSAELVFTVTDGEGKPSVGSTVNFSQVNPMGNNIIQDGLTVYTAESNASGQVSTSLKATGVIGNYTITVTLAEDTAKFAGTNVIVMASTPAKLTVIDGANQTIPASKHSARINFKLTDVFDNPIAEKVVNFQLNKSDGQIVDGILSTVMATSDINGKVSLYLKSGADQGIYTVTASLLVDTNVTSTVPITITQVLPQLPSLGFGAAFNLKGEQVNSNAIFHGGTLVRNEAVIGISDDNFSQEVVLNVNQTILVNGLISVDSNHIGQAADIIIVVGYKLIEPDGVETFFMFDENRIIRPWDGILDNLIPVMRIASLPESQVVKIYDAQLAEDVIGRLRIYFGYRLDDGVIVFNASQAISLLVK